MNTIVDVVIRHPREKLYKCSLEPLRGRPDIRFFKATKGFSFEATGFLLLAVDAPPISPEDAEFPLLILDSTWRLLPQLRACVAGTPVLRSLPASLKTAYPRISKISEDPVRGLASVEALFAARWCQRRPLDGLLDQYHWRSHFLRQFEEF